MKLKAIVSTLVAVTVFAAPAAATTLYAPEYYGPGDTVRAFDVAADGGLTPTGPPSQFGIFGPSSAGIGSIAIAPDGVRGVAGFYFLGGIQGLSFAPSGAITPAQAVTGSDKGTVVAVSPDGRFAYHAIGGGTQGVAAYAMDANGALTALVGSPFQNAESFFGLAIRPDGKFLYAGASNSIRPFAVAADGKLTALPSVPVPGTDLMQFSSDGTRLIVGKSSNQLASFNVGSDGSLTAAGTPVTVGSTWGGFFSLSPDGRFVYVTDYNGDALGGPTSINAYAIASDGALSFSGASSVEPWRPRAVTVSPNGRFLYANDASAGKLVVGTIGANGLPTAFRAVGDWSSGEPIPVVFRPEQAPTASFKSSLASKPLTMTFDAAASTAPDGSIEGFNWSFGDGTAELLASTARTTHVFPRAGVYSVKLTADSGGCSTKTMYNGQTTSCVGSAAAASTVLIDTPPWITSLKVSPSKVTKKTKIKFKLTESASVSFYVQKPLKGRKVGTSCKKQTSKNKKAKKCARWVRASKTFRKSGKGGKTTSFKFTGKVGKTKLKKGSYRFYATATDKAKNKGPAVTAKFKIKK